MKTDPTISFRQDMIDLIIAGKKTVTIRPIKPQPEIFSKFSKGRLSSRTYWEWKDYDLSRKGREWLMKQYPHGRVGDTMTIRERPEVKLKITGITVDWLQKIRSEWMWDGVKLDIFIPYDDELPKLHWNSFYGGTEYEWIKNPWVWIIEFELIEEKG